MDKKLKQILSQILQNKFENEIQNRTIEDFVEGSFIYVNDKLNLKMQLVVNDLIKSNLLNSQSVLELREFESNLLNFLISRSAK